MPTTSDYRPRHKRPQAFAGSTPRGPERWARAAHNALTNPRSAGAKLFMDRLANARALADKYEKHSAPLEFLDAPNGRRLITDPNAKTKRKYVACGVHCAMMQAQLDWNTLDREVLEELIQVGVWIEERQHGGRTYKMYDEQRIRALNLSTLTRAVRCTVCGTSVKPPRKR